MPASDWLNQNSHRDYPFEPSDFIVGAGSFDGKAAFADAGFTMGIFSAFEHGRDHVYLDHYYKTDTVVRFVFRLAYGASAEYEAMKCYEWVFEFPISNVPLGTTVYAVPTRITIDDTIGPENPAMGLAFLSAGNLEAALAGTVNGYVPFTGAPQIEPALLQSNVNTFVNAIRVANEERPCPPDCDCQPSSSGSSDIPSSDSSSSSVPLAPVSSSSSSTALCEDPDEPEPTALTAPVRLPLPVDAFTDIVNVKAGYNCVIEVQETANAVVVRSKLYGGEGMQCEDLRIESDGEPVPDSCQSCGNLVYAVNDYGYDVERLQLVGGQGVIVVPDPDRHRVVVMLEEDGVCEVGV